MDNFAASTVNFVYYYVRHYVSLYARLKDTGSVQLYSLAGLYVIEGRETDSRAITFLHGDGRIPKDNSENSANKRNLRRGLDPPIRRGRRTK